MNSRPEPLTNFVGETIHQREDCDVCPCDSQPVQAVGETIHQREDCDDSKYFSHNLFDK